jgi:ubiquinone biosynthesis protein UbiJ
MSTETLLLTPIEQLINRILLLDPASSARLD